MFPLPGVIILPNGNLPLNIFEPRYISMVEDALGKNRMIGMIQPNPGSKKYNGLYPIGSASKIISFSETSDNRYLIELKGIIRFKIFKDVISKIDSSATFWLDAHWDGDVMGEYKCPLPFELEALLSHPIKEHTLLIDDRRFRENQSKCSRVPLDLNDIP